MIEYILEIKMTIGKIMSQKWNGVMKDGLISLRYTDTSMAREMPSINEKEMIYYVVIDEGS